MHEDPQDDSGEDNESPSEGYVWGFARQERELPAKDYRAHIRLLDEVEEEELERLDLSRVDDSTARHPALNYADILLRLSEHLKDRGDYDEAVAALDKAEGIEPDLHVS